jgi:hypothetical protein
MTIRLISTTANIKVLVDRAPKGTASKGDVLWAKSILSNAVYQFGRPNVSTFTVAAPPAGDVKVGATLPGGTIRVAGRSPATRRPSA